MNSTLCLIVVETNGQVGQIDIRLVVLRVEISFDKSRFFRIGTNTMNSYKCTRSYLRLGLKLSHGGVLASEIIQVMVYRSICFLSKPVRVRTFTVNGPDNKIKYLPTGDFVDFYRQMELLLHLYIKTSTPSRPRRRGFQKNI